MIELPAQRYHSGFLRVLRVLRGQKLFMSPLLWLLPVPSPSESPSSEMLIFTQRSINPQSAIRPQAFAIAIIKACGGNSSIGRAPDCGSDGCGFDSRFPPQTSSVLAQAFNSKPLNTWDTGRHRGFWRCRFLCGPRRPLLVRSWYILPEALIFCPFRPFPR